MEEAHRTAAPAITTQGDRRPIHPCSDTISLIAAVSPVEQRPVQVQAIADPIPLRKFQKIAAGWSWYSTQHLRAQMVEVTREKIAGSVHKVEPSVLFFVFAVRDSAAIDNQRIK
ncbi:MAG: hypothetical protein ACLUOS_12710 [Odoribacter splanchnicus]